MRKVSIILPYYNRRELLIRTLISFEKLYQGYDLEVVIVDDGSNEKNRLEDVVKGFDLDIKLIRLENKNGINPCYPYNVGVRESSGDIIILSSPETFHTTDMFKISKGFNELSIDTYLLFSVFCLTDHSIIDNIDIDLFHKNLGENGYPYNNNYGSWYTHSKYRPSGLNFFTAITKERFVEMSGFDERFRYGTGFDDNEFKDRLLEDRVKFIYVDDANAIHVDHEVVNNMAPTTNHSLYDNRTKYEKNNKWGLK